jgi:hypothetical protein
MQRSWSDFDSGNPKYFVEKGAPVPLQHHKSHLDYSGFELGPTVLEVDDDDLSSFPDKWHAQTYVIKESLEREQVWEYT